MSTISQALFRRALRRHDSAGARSAARWRRPPTTPRSMRCCGERAATASSTIRPSRAMRRFATISPSSPSRRSPAPRPSARLLHQCLQRVRDRRASSTACRPLRCSDASAISSSRRGRSTGRRSRCTISSIAVIRPLGGAANPFRDHLRVEVVPVPAQRGLRGGEARAQLDEQARQFVNDTYAQSLRRCGEDRPPVRDLQVVRRGFPRRAGSVQKFIAHYVDDPVLARDLEAGALRIEWIDYDWRLNGTPPRS